MDSLAENQYPKDGTYAALKNFYLGKKVLVTGHTGFKGAWLSRVLEALGAKVIGYSKTLPEDPNHAFFSIGLSFRGRDDFKARDVRNLAELEAFINEHEPDVIFHLAAQAIVSESIDSPITTFSTNTMGSANVLEAYRKRSKSDCTLVLVTSDKCYWNDGRAHAYVETDRLGGSDPYSGSKAAAEIIFRSYVETFLNRENHAVVSVRAGNVFGGGDWSQNRLVPDCIRELLQFGTITLRMPEATRPWTFVLDVLFGYLLIGMKISKEPSLRGSSLNFASGELMTVKDVAEVILRKFGEGQLLRQNGSLAFRESALLQIDASLARESISWRPSLSLVDALDETVNWYLRQSEGANMADYSEKLLNKMFRALDS